jgi:hypothetical protein
MGLLLEAVEPGKNRYDARHVPEGTPSNRKDAADRAGISEKQKDSALAIE